MKVSFRRSLKMASDELQHYGNCCGICYPSKTSRCDIHSLIWDIL